MTTTMHRKDQSLALPIEPDPGKRKLSTAKAMQEAISQRMARDESVFVMARARRPLRRHLLLHDRSHRPLRP